MVIPMTHSLLSDLYICSCAPDGGILECRLYDDGHIEKTQLFSADRPMYAVIDEKKLHVLLRAPFSDSNDSGYIFFDIKEDKSLSKPSKAVSTKGEVACHLYVEKDSVYAVNYISGSVTKCGEKTVCHSGKGVNLPRQNGPHTHFVGKTPDEKYLLVTDLGLDTVFVYDKELDFVNSAKVPEGHGVRHLVFSDDGKYLFAANELCSTVSVFEYKEGKLTLIDTASCIPEGFSDETTASAIRYKNGKVYVSNRGHDSIAVLELKDGKLFMTDIFSCGGFSPRDFDIIGDFFVCTNEKSDSVTVVKDGKLVSEINVKSPICVTKH